jgi:hypothetical protein
MEYQNLLKSGKFVSGRKRDIYEKVKTPHGILQKGDIVVWEDPDCAYHNEDITQQLFVGYVDKVYDIEDSDLEFSITAPLGRIDMRYTRFISGKEIYYYENGHKHDSKFILQFINSDYEDYMTVKWDIEGNFHKDGN